jgi:hypothetical protein
VVETIRKPPQEQRETANITIDGHKVQLHFAPEPSETVMENVRELLVRSLVGASANEKKL